MRPRPAVSVTALLVTLAFAGCFGDDPPKPAQPGNVCPPEDARCAIGRPVAAGLGKVTGQVIDDAFAPLVAATVTLREKDLSTTTDDAGRFAFNDLEPGTYTVFAQAPGHIAQGRQVDVGADAVVEADLILEAAPPPVRPWLDEDDKVGLIACSVAHGAIRGADWCAATDGNAVSVFEFPLGARLTDMFVYLHADPGPLGSAEFSVTVDRPASLQPKGATGPAPLEHQWHFDEENNFQTWEEGGIVRFDVRASHEADMPQLVYQQRIRLYVGLFYEGHPVPDGYTAYTDG